MVTNDEYCGLKFAFDLPDCHPAFLDGDEILFERAYAIHDMCSDLEFVQSDFAGAKMTVVFEYDGKPDGFEDAYYAARDWLNAMYEGYEPEEN